MAERLESVRFRAVDEYTTPVARMAAATALLNRELNSLSGQEVRTGRSTRTFAGDIDRTAQSVNKAGPDIDRFSGRLAFLGDVAATLGPSLVPIAAVGVPALAGLASALGFTVVGMGTAVAAFQGVGDALDAVNKAQLEPTEANLRKAKDALEDLSPAAQDLVHQLHDMIPELKTLRDTAAAGFFPGLVDGLDAMEGALPRVQRILAAVSTELGDIARDTGESLASERWEPFLDFIAREAPEALADLAAAAGDTAHGVAELWMAFDPLNDDVLGWLTEGADDFDRWASSLSRTDGFAEFVDYIRTTGPQVGETLVAIGDALLQIVEAAAPLGGPTLQIIETLAKAVATIADSDLGTPLLALASAGAAVRMMGRLSTALEGVALSAGGAKGALRGVAESAGTLGIVLAGTGFLNDSLSIQDSLGRSRDAADSTAQSIADLAEALQESNVGKFASDLGIDVQRLAEDLYENGRSGTYASRVLADLAEHSHGFGAALNAMGGTILPFYTANADKAYDANKDLKAIIEGSEGAAGRYGFGLDVLGAAVDEAGTKANRFSTRQRRLNAQLRANRQAAREQGQAWLQFGDNLDDTDVSLRGWVASLRRQAAALENFTTNARRAAIKGLREGLIRELQAAGPEGALRMRQLANATETEIARANAAWARGQHALRDYANFKIPRKRVDVDTYPARRALADLQANIDRLHGKTVGVVVEAHIGGAGKAEQLIRGSFAASGGVVQRDGATQPPAELVGAA